LNVAVQRERIVKLQVGCYAKPMGRSPLRDGDVISGAVLAALGVYIVLEARNWTYSGPEGPGPGFFPTWYGLGMVALSLVLIVSKVTRRTGEESEAPNWRDVGRALMTWLAFVGCAALLKPLGFLISFTLLTFFIVAVIFRRSLVTALTTAALSGAAFHLLFPVALSVDLPKGFLGF
jgi:putative tricarboxylic transport membrane protein